MQASSTRRSLLTLTVLIAMGACNPQPATQILVTVTSDLPASDLVLIRAIAVATDATGGTPSAREFDLSEAATPRATLPLSFGVLPPSDGGGRPVELTVSAIGHGSPGREIVRRVVRTSFIHGRTLLLRVSLTAACVGRACGGSGSTCDQGQCVSTSIDPGSLPSVVPGHEFDDGGAPMPTYDAAPGDAPVMMSCRETPPSIHLGAPGRPSAMVLVRGPPAQPAPVLLAYSIADQLQLQTYSADLSTSTTGAAEPIGAGPIALEGAAPASSPTYRWVGAYRTAGGLTLFDATSPGPTVHSTPFGALASAALVRGGVVELDGGHLWLVWQQPSGLALTELDLSGPSVVPGAVHTDVLVTSGAPFALGVGGGFAIADAAAGRCRLTSLRSDGTTETSVTLTTQPGCEGPSVAQLAGGNLLVAYHLPPSGSPTPRVAFQIVRGGAITVAVPERVLGDSANSTLPVAIVPRLDGGALAIWMGPLNIAYAAVDSDGAIGVVRGTTAPGATSADFATFRAVRADDTHVAVAWIANAGIQIGLVCDRP